MQQGLHLGLKSVEAPLVRRSYSSGGRSNPD